VGGCPVENPPGPVNILAEVCEWQRKALLGEWPNQVLPGVIEMSDYNVLEHDNVPEHHLVDVAEEKKILTKFNIGKDQLPKIRKSDPCIKLIEEAKGIDIEEGRLIRIVRTHAVSGVSVAYRVVVRG